MRVWLATVTKQMKQPAQGTRMATPEGARMSTSVLGEHDEPGTETQAHLDPSTDFLNNLPLFSSVIC